MIRLVISFVCIFYLAGFFFFKNYIDALSAGKYPENLEAVVLFTGGHGRLEMGDDYLKAFPNKPLLITGVHPGVTMDILIKEGFFNPENSQLVQLDYEARDTIENVHMVQKWAEKNSFTHIGLITSAYHIPRSLLLFDRITPQLKITPLPVRNTKTSIFYLFKEYNKNLYTYIVSA